MKVQGGDRGERSASHPSLFTPENCSSFKLQSQYGRSVDKDI